MVRRGAGQREGVRRRPPTRHFCTTFHADDQAYFDKVSYWTTPRTQCGDGRGDGVQGLRGLGAGLDRDQGIRGRGRTAGATASPARAAAQRAAGLARRRLPRLARRPLRLGLLAARRLQRRDRQAVRRSTTSSCSGRTPVYRRIALRTIGIAALVTVTDALLAFPIAFFMAQARRAARLRGLLVVADPHAAVGLLSREGLRVARDPLRGRDPQLGAGAAGASGPGLRLRRHVAGLQLPVAAVHDPAASTRGSSASPTRCSTPPATSAARPGRPSAGSCCRSPSRRVVAGSIFTFSLTLGDYITPQLVSSHAVHRQRRLRQRRRRQQPPAGGGVRHGPGPRDDRLPPRRPAAGRVRGALMQLSGSSQVAAAARDRAHARVPLRPAASSSSSTRSTPRACRSGRRRA